MEQLGLSQYTTEELITEAEKRLASEIKETSAGKLISFDEVEETDTTWLYCPYVPRGKVTVVGAYPGTGKTFLLCYMSACVSTGRQFFNVSPFTAAPENVLFITSEDGLGDTLKRRLRLCGADMKKVFSITDTSDIVFDNPIIEEYIRQVHPALLIFDPFQSYIGENVDVNAANKTRAKLNHLVNLAEKYNVAIVLICHFNKNSKGDSITRILGSTDIVGVARSYLALGNVPDTENTKYMSHEKSSLEKRGNTILFEINPEQGGIRYLGESTLSMDDYISRGHESKRKTAPALEEAKEFLKAQMPNGKRSAAEIKRLADANHITDSTLRRAQKELGIVVKKEGFHDGWIWYLPRETS